MSTNKVRDYPEKFVVKSTYQDYVWDVSLQDDGRYKFVCQDDSSATGVWTDDSMDAWGDGYQFIFPEPELVFPFTYITQYFEIDPYEVSKDEVGGLWWTNVADGWRSTEPNLWTMQEVKDKITSATWIITSVGEQKLAASVLSPAMNAIESAEGLTIKIDTEAATEAMNALAEAIESINIGLESMQKLMAEMGLKNV